MNVRSAITLLLAERREADIQSRLREVLEAETGCEWVTEFPVSSGSADLGCTAKRTIVEVKGFDVCGPNKPGSQAGETQKGQVLRYLKAIEEEPDDLFSAGNADVPWTGWLTNGRYWWGWTLEDGEAVPVSGTENGRSLWTPQEVSIWIRSKIRREGDDRRLLLPVPPNLAAIHLEPVRQALLAATNRLSDNSGYRTKQAVWAMALRGAGMVAPEHDREQRNDLFATHTTLLLAAQAIVATLQPTTEPTNHQLSQGGLEGLTSWINADAEAYEEATYLTEMISRFDWRGSAQDHLRDAFHTLIDRRHRKEFGEYYTPDWLAEQVVRTTLDEDWLDSAIEESVNGYPVESGVVLDPACGSGTFLLHAARRIGERIAQSYSSIEHRDARKVIIRLVKGIDIHPIAVELAKATLEMALPPGPAHGEIILGDTLQTAMSGEETIWTNKSTVEYVSPGGRRVTIPRGVLEHDSMRLDMVRELSARANTGQRSASWNSGPPRLHRALQKTQEQLESVIEAEGDDIWSWHLSQLSGSLLLARRRVGRIVTNPPWIVVNDTPEGDRKRRLWRLQQHLKVQTTPSGASSKGDLACLFTARSAELYLKVGGRMGMVLPGSALTAQTWTKWRSGAWGPGVTMHLEEGYDLSSHNPLPFPHAPNGTSVVYARRQADTAKALQMPRPARPWAPSDYVGRVRRGACAQPHGLLYVENHNILVTDEEGVVEITTKRSTKGRWRDVALHSRIERAALLPVVTSRDIQPFRYQSSRHIIAPTQIERDGTRCLRWSNGMPNADDKFPFTLRYWADAEIEYRKRRAETAGETLLDNLDWKRTLRTQLNAMTEENAAVKVVVNKSGKSGLKAARIPLDCIADDMLYYIICSSESEALYLCAIINAPCMRDVWNDTKTSIMHYDKNPWRKIPIRRYDRGESAHYSLVGLSQEAENDFSSEIKQRLDDEVGKLLPQYSRKPTV